MIEFLAAAALIAVVLLSLAQTRRVRNFVLSSRPYKKAFALHMSIFSPIHNKAVQQWKEELFSSLKPSAETAAEPTLDILEIGVGTGANFQFFPAGTSVIAVDPNPNMEGYLRNNASSFPHIHLEKVITAEAEHLKEIPENSVGNVVCTLTLCSVNDVGAVLSEVRRVLKPGGCFYYLEHIADEAGTWRCTFQRVLDGTWKYFSDGCSCHLETWKYIEEAGFSSVSQEKRCAKSLTSLAYLMKPHLLGFAIK